MSFLSDLLGNSYKENMTEDEISAALEAANNAKQENDNKIKSALSRANSEAAEYKKKMQELQGNYNSESEALKQRIAELEKINKLSQNKSLFMQNGYSDEQATELASAYEDGDIAKILEIEKSLITTKEQEFKANALKATPRPATVGEPAKNSSPSLASKLESKYYAEKYGINTSTKEEKE